MAGSCGAGTVAGSSGSAGVPGSGTAGVTGASGTAGVTGSVGCGTSAVVRVGSLSIGLIGLLGRRNFPDTFNREVVKLLEFRDIGP